MTDDRRSLARTPWKTLSTRPIYANEWIRVREDVAEYLLRMGARLTIWSAIALDRANDVRRFVESEPSILTARPSHGSVGLALRATRVPSFPMHNLPTEFMPVESVDRGGAETAYVQPTIRS